MFTNVLPTIHGRPLSMNAYVRVLLIGTDLAIDLNTTLHLSWNESASRWEGTIQDGSLQTTVTVSTTGDPEVFDLAASTANMGTPLTGGAWSHFQAQAAERWATGALLQVNAPDIDEVTLTILA